MKVIGITGGIGSGKSTVTNVLRKMGYTVLDADKIAREIVEKDSPTLKRLADTFGGKIICAGELDRKALAAIVFVDKEKRKVLDQITHSEIKNIMATRISIAKENGENMLFVDAPLLFEAKVDEMTDENWLIFATEEVRLKRAMERDNSAESEVKKVMSHQMKEEDKKKLVDVILENMGTVSELEEKVELLIKSY